MSNPFALRHPGGLHIACGLQESMLLHDHRALIVEPRERLEIQSSDWVWHRLTPWMDGGFRVGIELVFFQGALSECLLFHDDDSLYGRDWNEWSEDKERKRAKALRLWLASRGWAAGRYDWGDIWVGYEPRTGLGGGWVRYAGSARA